MHAPHGGSDSHSHQRARRRGQWTPLARALASTGNHWTLLIALGLAQGAQRPVQLQRRIAGLSGAVLDRHVQQMVAGGLVSRRRYREMPPRVELELTDAGRELLPIAGALARWGMRHAWSAPSQLERIDLVSLLELLPLLVEEATDLPDGTLALVVLSNDEQGTPAPKLRRCFAIEDGELRLLGAEREAGPDASAKGTGRDWIAALGPARDLAGLEVDGRAELIEAVFAALPQTIAPRTRTETRAQGAMPRTPASPPKPLFG